MKRSSSEAMHEYAKSRWDGIQQYFYESDREKNKELKENRSIILKSAHSDPGLRSYRFTDNSDLNQQIQETTETDIEAKRRLILLSAIKQGKERLLKNKNESRVIYFKDDVQIFKDGRSVSKANVTEKIHDDVGNRWSGIQQYFQEKDYEKKEKLEENITPEERNELETNTTPIGEIHEDVEIQRRSIQHYFSKNSNEITEINEENLIIQEKATSSDGDELVTTLNIGKKLRENAGNTWMRVQQYFSRTHAEKSKGTEEIEIGESSRLYYGQRVSNYYSTESSQMDPQILETAEKMHAKEYTQLSAAKYSARERNDERKEAVGNASEFHNGIVMASSELYSRNEMAWGTEDLTGSNLEGIWKMGCELRRTVANAYEFRWKVKLKLKPTKKTVYMPELTPTSSKVQRPKKYEISDVLRKYKIVFVGDSGVGKTSFIRRYCNNSFKLSFHSTVGVDYREKKTDVNGERSVLQLWDTAGQEKFRSMCVQYYRKSDAVIAIYDVTSEKSFKNIRRWIDDIQETTDSGKLIMLIGNKIDAIDFKLNNAVPTAHGTLLAEDFISKYFTPIGLDCNAPSNLDEYDALFFETSVKYDENVTEAMTELIKLLEKRIQKERKQLTLEMKNAEKKCC